MNKMEELCNSEIHDIELDQYWESIPKWSNNNPNFKIMADEYSARIPVTRIDHWRELSTLLESNFFNRPDTELVYRGHRRFDWGLMPTLGRLSLNGIVTDDLADKQLRLFRQTVRGRISDNALLEDDEQRNELWAVGQHYGLMTPLLDWTYSPYVALFFAFSKKDKVDEKPNPYRAIYIINKSFLETDEVKEEIQIFEPKKDDHGRLVSQAGLFTIPPSDATIENKLMDLLEDVDFSEAAHKIEDEGDDDSEAKVLARYICKIYIKNINQVECVTHLRRMNVHHASLFPDLQGASDHCNNILSTNYLEGSLLPTILVEGELEKLEDKEESIGDVSVKGDYSANDTDFSQQLIDTSVPTKPISDYKLNIKTPIIEKIPKDDFYKIVTGTLFSSDDNAGSQRSHSSVYVLYDSLEDSFVVDWYHRESSLSKIRNIIRRWLRTNGLDNNLLGEVMDNLIESMSSQKAEV